MHECDCCILADEFDNRTLVLQFGPNQTVGSVMIQANHDLILENDEVFYVRLELTEESEIIGVNVDEPNVATVTIINTNGTIHALQMYHILILYLYILLQLFL